MNRLPAGRPRWWRRVLATMAVAAAAVIASTVAALPAHAAGSLPDPGRTATLRIHAMASPGAVGDPAGAVPLIGADFVIRQLDGIDLTTSAGWATASALLPGFDPSSNEAAEASIARAGISRGAPLAGATDADGSLTFADLPLGAYLVEQVSAPAGTFLSRPGIVLLPMTDPRTHDAWLYDVDLYPKPTTLVAGKTVDDADAAGPDDPVTWTITAAIAARADAPPVIDAYRIADRIDARLAVRGVTVRLSDGAPLAAADYVIAGPDIDGLLTIEFAPSGLSVLAAHLDAAVVVAIDTTVREAGVIPNSALVYPNAASFGLAAGDPGGPIQTGTAVIRWGTATVAKVDKSNRPLRGAVFSAYRTESDARADRNPIAFGGATRLPVDDDGLLTLTPLRYSDWAAGYPVAPRDYYLVEVEAPSGYQRLSDPIPFRVDAQSTEPGVDVSVANVLVRGDSDSGLAFTGSQVLPMLRIGVLALGAGALLLLAIRRRRSRGAPPVPAPAVPASPTP